MPQVKQKLGEQGKINSFSLTYVLGFTNTMTGLFVYLIVPNTMEQLKGPCEL